jgi:hypothetical protein
MRDLGRRLLIGIAVAAAAVMAIGYAFIAGRIAAPLGSDLATLPMPFEHGARALQLDDGRPAFLVVHNGVVTVVDARAPHAAGAPGSLVSWCAPEEFFVDIGGGATYAADGELLGGTGEGGLVVYPVREVDDGSRIVVGADGRRAGTRVGGRPPVDCPADSWVTHRADPDEVFDPSVAADGEPPGWIWLEGALDVIGGDVRLCDGLDGRCDTSAAAGGIDPASVPTGDGRLIGSFIGRVRDDAIEDLNFVPDPGDVP